jgi:hypothetical protein
VSDRSAESAPELPADLRSQLLVALIGLITGIAAAMSMAGLCLVVSAVSFGIGILMRQAFGIDMLCRQPG